MADALFRSNRYPGFRILGSMTVDRARASYLADGVLVIPEGLVLLELKDHWGRIEIPLESGADMRPERRKPERNPVNKLKTALRHFSGWVPDLPLDHWQRKMAAVVFTNPGAQVFGVRASGQVDAAPLISGEVMVAGTARFPALLADFLKPFRSQSKGGRVRLLSPAEIEEVAGRLAAGQEEEAEDPEAWRIGSYSFDRKPAQETGYHALHTGRSNRGKPVLLKHYRLKSLMRGDRDAALAALGREAEILSELPQDPRLERLLGHGEDGDAYYVILEAVQAPDLDQWLGGDPPRAERLAILRDLAELLALLAEADVVHRGITPKSLRVRDGRPVLTGFELARLDSVATLLVDARRLFDQQYQAREVFVGGVLGPATDSYSLGALAIRMLAGTLPFRDFQELAVRRGKPGFWEKIAAGMALPPSAAADVKRLLSPDPIQRPTGRALVDLVSGWS
ncbi:protein kinase [Azospirillum sp. INR13]|uniref:protein kinase domain-containing protein n=1 Tax=Azospirillum sp. INR13 TaxID=2596919 RepID=UPI001891F548|nr:protein kinase [Azospirillum sp. INR13]